MSHTYEGPLATYNSLMDRHLAGYFSQTKKKKHLRRAGLISRRGEVISEATFRLNMARKEHKKHVKNLLAQAIVHKTLDMERTRQVAIRKKLEEIAKVELVRRVRAEKARKGDEDILPYLSPRGKGSSRPRSAAMERQQAVTRSRARPTSAPSADRKGRSHQDDEDDDEWEYDEQDKKLRPIYIDENGMPVHPREFAPEGQSSPSSSGQHSPRSPYPKEEIDTKHLYALDNVALREYTMNNDVLDKGRGAPSPYVIPLVGLATPSPPATRRSPRQDRTKAKSRKFRYMATDPLGRPLHPKSNKGSLMLHRLEPAMMHQARVQSMCEVTMLYIGGNLKLEAEGNDPMHEIIVEQQHCGGNTLNVFKGRILPGTRFTFTSRRHRGYPFSLTFYINGVKDIRLSVCCEYKHKPGFRLGGVTGHFGFVKTTGAAPCYRCQVEKGLMIDSSPPRPEKKRPSEAQQKKKNKKKEEKEDEHKSDDEETKSDKVFVTEASDDDKKKHEDEYEDDDFEDEDEKKKQDEDKYEEDFDDEKEEKEDKSDPEVKGYDDDFENDEGTVKIAAQDSIEVPVQDTDDESVRTSRSSKNDHDEEDHWKKRPEPIAEEKSRDLDDTETKSEGRGTEAPSGKADDNQDDDELHSVRSSVSSTHSKKSDRSAKSEKSDHSVRSDRSVPSVKSEKSDHSVRSDRSERSVKSEKSDHSVRSDRSERSVKSAKSDHSVKSDRSDKSVKSNKSDRSVKSDKSDRSVRSEKSDRSVKSDRSDRSAKSDKSDRTVTSQKSDRSVKSDKSDATIKSDHSVKSDKSDHSKQSDRSGKSDRSKKSDRSNASKRSERSQHSTKEEEMPQAKAPSEQDADDVASVKSEGKAESVKSEGKTESVKSEGKTDSVRSAERAESIKSAEKAESVKSAEKSESVKSDEKSEKKTTAAEAEDDKESVKSNTNSEKDDGEKKVEDDRRSSDEERVAEAMKSVLKTDASDKEDKSDTESTETESETEDEKTKGDTTAEDTTTAGEGTTTADETTEAETAAETEAETEDEKDDTKRETFELSTTKLGDLGNESPQDHHGHIRPLVEGKADIDLTSVAMTDDQVKELGNILKETSDAKSINLRNGTMNDEQMEEFASALKQTPSKVQLLNLNLNKLGTRGVNALTAALRETPSIQILLLNDNPLGDEGVVALAEGLAVPEIDEIEQQKKSEQKKINKLAKNIVTSAIDDALRSPSMTSIVSRGSSDQRPGSASSASSTVSLCRGVLLHELDLGSCDVRAEGAIAIGRLIAQDASINVLNLSGNRYIGSDGWRAIGDSLKKNSTLKTLALNSCNMGNAGLMALRDGLAQNKSLRTIDLEDNDIRDVSARMLLDAVKANKNILEVMLGPNNAISKDIVANIQDILKERQ